MHGSTGHFSKTKVAFMSINGYVVIANVINAHFLLQYTSRKLRWRRHTKR